MMKFSRPTRPSPCRIGRWQCWGGRCISTAPACLDSIVSTFSRNVDAVDAPEKELLAAPMAFVVETPQSGRLNWTNDSCRIASQSSGAVGWEARSHAGALELQCAAKLECDGYANFKLTLRATEATELQDIRLEIPLRRDRAVYMMGMGCKGGYRPPRGNGSGTPLAPTASSGSETWMWG